MIHEYYTDGNKTFLEIVGPGIWFELHVLGLQCRNRDKDKQNRLVDKVNYLLSYFFCSICRNHFRLLCKKIPLNKFFDIIDEHGNDIGPFKWTWLIHNRVNQRLGKDTIPLNIALRMYEEVLESIEGNRTCSIR